MKVVMSKFRSIIHGAVTVFGIKISGTVLAFVITALITRNMGAEASGTFFYLYSLVLFGSAVARCGLDNVFLRYIAPKAHPEMHDEVSSIAVKGLSIVVLVSIFISILSIITFYVTDFGLQLNASETTAVCLALWAIPLIAVVQSSSFVFQAVGKFLISTFLFNAITSLFFLGFLLATDELTLSAALNQLFFSSGFAAFFGIVLFVRNFKFSISSNARPQRKELLAVGVPMWITLLTNQLLNYLPIFLGGIWLTTVEISFLSVSQRMAMFLSFFLLAISYVVSPMLSRAFDSKNIELAQKIVSAVTYVSLFISLSALMVIAAFSELILSIFGPEFVSATSILMGYLIAQVFNITSGCVNLMLMFSKQQDAISKIAIATLVFSVLIYPVMMSVFGVQGAVLGVALSFMFRAIVSIVLAKRRTGIFVLRLPLLR